MALPGLNEVLWSYFYQYRGFRQLLPARSYPHFMQSLIQYDMAPLTQLLNINTIDNVSKTTNTTNQLIFMTTIPIPIYLELINALDICLLYTSTDFKHIKIFYKGVPGLATDCPCSVWCCGLTTCLLYVGPPVGNLVWNDSGFVSLT